MKIGPSLPLVSCCQGLSFGLFTELEDLLLNKSVYRRYYLITTIGTYLIASPSIDSNFVIRIVVSTVPFLTKMASSILLPTLIGCGKTSPVGSSFSCAYSS